jgi:hypothetical protein
MTGDCHVRIWERPKGKFLWSTRLSKRGVLLADTGRGATSKTRRAKASRARGSEASKKKRKAAVAA